MVKYTVTTLQETMCSQLNYILILLYVLNFFLYHLVHLQLKYKTIIEISLFFIYCVNSSEFCVLRNIM